MNKYYSPTYGKDPKSGSSSTNSDLEKLLKEQVARREQASVSNFATSQLTAIPGKEIEIAQRKRDASAILASANVGEIESKSFMDKVSSVLDAPSKYVARPLMAASLAGIFTVMPGEQAGEAALRKATGINPLGFFDSDRQDRMREALKETELPFGVYTAMEMALDPLNYVPLGYIGKGARALTKVDDALAAGGKLLDAPGKKLSTTQQIVDKLTKAPVVKHAMGAVPDVGGAAGKGSIPKASQLIPEIPEMDDLISQQLTGNKLEEVTKRLMFLPGVKQTVGVLNPKILVKSAEGKAVIAYAQSVAYADSFAIAASSQVVGNVPFQILKGKARLANGTQEAWGDLMSEGREGLAKRTADKSLDSDQVAYITKYMDILDEVNVMLRKEGFGKLIDAEGLGQYIPRLVRGSENIEHFRKNGVGKGFKDKPFSFKRYYDTMQEGLDAGVDYFDPDAVMAMHLRSVYRLVAEKRLMTSVVKTGLASKTGKVVRVRTLVKNSPVVLNASRLLGQSNAKLKVTKEVEQLVETLHNGGVVGADEFEKLKNAIGSRVHADPDLEARLLSTINQVEELVTKPGTKAPAAAASKAKNFLDDADWDAYDKLSNDAQVASQGKMTMSDKMKVYLKEADAEAAGPRQPDWYDNMGKRVETMPGHFYVRGLSTSAKGAKKLKKNETYRDRLEEMIKMARGGEERALAEKADRLKPGAAAGATATKKRAAAADEIPQGIVGAVPAASRSALDAIYNSLGKGTPTGMVGDVLSKNKKAKLDFDTEYARLLKDEDLASIGNGTPGMLFDGPTRKILQGATDQQRANQFIRSMGTANVVARLGLTGFDFGAGMIQGLALLATNPRGWARAQMQALNTLRDGKAYSAYIRNHNDTIMEMSRHGGSLNVDEFVEAYQSVDVAKQIFGKLGKSGEVLQAGSKRAGQAFTAFSLAARVELYESMRPMALRAARKKTRAGTPFDEGAALRDLVEHVSKLTGVSDQAKLGINTARSDWERALIFAPRYLRATTGMVADVFQGGMRGTMARDSMAKLLAGGTLMYYGLALAMGQEPKLDPTKGDFLTVDVNGTRIGIGSAWVSMARQTGKVLTQIQEDVGGTGEPNEQLFGLDPKDGILGRYIRSKSSPVIGLGWDIAKGRDMMGQPVIAPWDDPISFVMDEGASSILPIWLQGLLPDDVDMNPNSTWGGKAALMGAEFGGLRAFPTNFYAQRTIRRDALANVSFGMSWDKLDGTQKKALNTQDEQLKIMNQEVSLLQLESTDDEWRSQAELSEATTKISDDYDDKVSAASTSFDEMGGKAWRGILKNIGRDRRTLMRDISNPDGNYKTAIASKIDYFERNQSGDAVDIAYQAYVQDIIIGTATDVDPEDLIDIFGNIDYARKAEREKVFETEWGSKVSAAVKVRLEMGSGLDPMLSRWKQGLDLFSMYWEVGDTLAAQRGLTEQWKEFKANEGRARGDELKATVPGLEQLATFVGKSRTAMREKSPAMEAWLLQFGYISSIQNPTLKRLGPYAKAMIEKKSYDPFVLPWNN